MSLSLLLVTILLLSSCTSIRKEPEVVTVTKLIERNIPTVAHPKPVNLNDIKIYVVSPTENFEDFKKEFEAKNGADSYVAISVKDYENLGKNFAELRRYIESKFEPWMNWENQGLGGWDIDHIKACSRFNFEDPKQQRACFHWSNLQPLLSEKNLSKGAKLNYDSTN